MQRLRRLIPLLVMHRTRPPSRRAVSNGNIVTRHSPSSSSRLDLTNTLGADYWRWAPPPSSLASTESLDLRQLERVLQRPTILTSSRKSAAAAGKLPSISRERPEISEDPAKVLLSAVKNETATVSLATQCMLALHDQSRSMPVKEAQQLIKSSKLGQEVFWWLPSVRFELSRREASTELYACLTLAAHLLIAEGEEEQFWVELESFFQGLQGPERSDITDQVKEEYGWTGRFLGALIHIHLLRDVDKRADTAIRAYLRYKRIRASLPPTRSISVGAAVSVLSRSLMNGDYQNTDPILFDRMLESHVADSGDSWEHFEEWRSVKQMMVAHLLLCHPRGPDPEPALRYFYNVEQNQFHMFRHLPTIKSINASVAFLQKLVDTLKWQGRAQEAKWSRQFLWSLRDQRRSLLSQSKQGVS